jgi:DNA-binding response OmpR family regulator
MPARVVVVENMAAYWRSYALTLRGSGYSVFEAWDVDAALEMSRLAVPDVVVIDESAIDEAPFAFRRLRAHPRLRGVLIVALSDGVDRRKALIDRGVHAVVANPAREHDLVAAVRWVLEVYRLHDVLEEVG